VKFKLLQGRFGEMEPLADRAIAMADALDLPLVKAGVLNRFGPALFPLGEPERGERLMEEGLEIARSCGNPDDLAVGYVNYADILHLYGRSEHALALLDQGIPTIVSMDRSGRWLMLLRAEINFALGNWREARADLPPARGLALTGTRVNSNLRHAEQALGRGDTEEARDLLIEAWEILAGSIEPQFIAGAAALLAELQVRKRQIDEARATVTEALDRLQYCTEDAARVALIAAGGVAVEASGAEAACDVGDTDAAENAVSRAEMLLELVRASADEYHGPVEQALLATAEAETERARAGADAAELWQRAAGAWRELERPYPEALALRRRAGERGDRDRPPPGIGLADRRARVARGAGTAGAERRRAARGRGRGGRARGRGPVRAHRPRAPGAGAGRRRRHQPRDRSRAVHGREDGQRPRLANPRQARRSQPHRGGRRRAPPGAGRGAQRLSRSN
jgi:tetratricopeptide (TPR) repeat protein